MDLEQRVTDLTAEYYQLIGPEHHKDRDCHWYIAKVWSYGQPPFYRVEHYGYLCEIVEENIKYETYESAAKQLITYLEAEIESEKTNGDSFDN